MYNSEAVIIQTRVVLGGIKNDHHDDCVKFNSYHGIMETFYHEQLSTDQYSIWANSNSITTKVMAKESLSVNLEQ